MSESEFNERIRHLRNLVVMAFADGELGESEVTLLADRCQELDLGESDLNHAIRFGLGDDAALELPADKDQRVALMTDLIRMMAADGVLAESEKRLFALAAAKMQMSTEDLNQLIDSALD
ncbi:MAG: TerB family tellurite resistance protein [Planctomycetota bacterium]